MTRGTVLLAFGNWGFFAFTVTGFTVLNGFLFAVKTFKFAVDFCVQNFNSFFSNVGSKTTATFGANF